MQRGDGEGGEGDLNGTIQRQRAEVVRLCAEVTAARKVKLTKEALDAATRASYLKMVELAPKWVDPAEMDRYKPWDEADEEWRKDHRETVAAALSAVFPGQPL